MWFAIKRKVALSIGFPDLDYAEDVYFGPHLVEYCRRFKKKHVWIENMFALHHHRKNLKSFLKTRWKYGQNAVLARFVMKRYKLPAALIAFAFLSVALVFVLREFFPLYFLGALLGYLLVKVKLWSWISKNFGIKVLVGCLLLSSLGALVSIFSIYYGLFKGMKGQNIKICRT